MTIAILPGSTLSTGVNATVFSTGAFTPAPGKLLIACYSAERGSSLDPSTPVVNGHAVGAPWTLINSLSYTTTLFTRRKLFLFGCITGAAPASSTVTFDHTSEHHGAEASVFQTSGDASSNGLSQTFVQVVRSTPNLPNGTSLALTLASPGHPDNRAFGFFMHTAAETTTQRAGWTEIHDVNHTSPPQNLETQWRADSFETTASASWTTSSMMAGMAFEIKALATPVGVSAPILSGTAGNSQNTLTWTAVT